MTDKINIFNFDHEALRLWLGTQDESTFRAEQIFTWCYHRGILDFAQMSNLSKNLRAKLADIAEFKLPKIMHTEKSADGTCKWLLGLDGGGAIETVFIPEAGRGTLCISSQIGCALTCSFCSTATQGFSRNLTVAEIIGQVWLAHQELASLPLQQPRTITNVVFMGMGEPLLNYANVKAAIKILLDDHAFGLSKYRVTLSTSGVVPVLEQFCTELDAALAISLHAPDDTLRNELVPINRKYPLAELLGVCRKFYQGTNRSITFEYVMLQGVNDSVAQAKRLAKLLAGIPCKINLIPFNSFQLARYTSSSLPVITEFAHILQKAGYITTVRKTRGEDINAACGQLVGDFIDKTSRRQRIVRVALQRKSSVEQRKPILEMDMINI